MRTEDQRNIMCGGAPESYLKAYFKGLYFDLDDDEEVEILFSKDKFSLGEEKFSEIAESTGLSLISYNVNDDVTVKLKK
ncbi:hypothetical protein [Picrophilus oshimae]|uniref:Uncharacterized protein n=1 Tax=Picrophilus torridus (strain ATCC 700027 / DSM 9790 / JCM 10055 / NBRC 100828 / KAW 2/3) TaxID=1122961 RepID=Q6L0P0_PICTO|nr:hypothetical protein [Picrophilus oshimae]AAT43462.1 hypothetical protein PTO0877 [Picrophilus oshimae DSM 9789]SMD30229.1 hypothetical protein SAMN02745355_0095 [Picrophilus oshimae DSM 9789]